MNEDEFIVEKILNKKTLGDQILYLVKWEGYSDEENTWEYQENLLGNCYDLINDYHKNKFFKDHRKYITEFKDKRGNLNRDRPFCIFRRNQYQFLVTFYPKKYQFVGSRLMSLNQLPKQFLNFIDDYKIEGEYNNEEIGCIAKFDQENSLVILLKDKRAVCIKSSILIQNYPELVIDYLESLVWKKID